MDDVDFSNVTAFDVLVSGLGLSGNLAAASGGAISGGALAGAIIGGAYIFGMPCCGGCTWTKRRHVAGTCVAVSQQQNLCPAPSWTALLACATEPEVCPLRVSEMLTLLQNCRCPGWCRYTCTSAGVVCAAASAAAA